MIRWRASLAPRRAGFPPFAQILLAQLSFVQLSFPQLPFMQLPFVQLPLSNIQHPTPTTDRLAASRCRRSDDRATPPANPRAAAYTNWAAPASAEPRTAHQMSTRVRDPAPRQAALLDRTPPPARRRRFGQLPRRGPANPVPQAANPRAAPAPQGYQRSPPPPFTLGRNVSISTTTSVRISGERQLVAWDRSWGDTTSRLQHTLDAPS